MRRALLWFVLVGLAAPALPGDEPYYVVLRDGAWVRAAEKPSVEEGMAHVRLPSGLVALLAAERIDWRRSDARSRQMRAAYLSDVPRQAPVPREELPGVLTIVNAPGRGPARPAPAVKAPPSAPMPTDAAASLRGRINTLDAGISELQTRKRDLLQRAHASYSLDEAAKLRKQAEQLDGRIGRLREEKERLLRQLWNLQKP